MTNQPTTKRALRWLYGLYDFFAPLFVIASIFYSVIIILWALSEIGWVAALGLCLFWLTGYLFGRAHATRHAARHATRHATRHAAREEVEASLKATAETVATVLKYLKDKGD